MNQFNKTILRDEIQWLLEAITEQFEAINAYEDKIPQIEFDIIMENIRKLYENLHVLNRNADSFRHYHPEHTEAPSIKPFVPAEVEMDQQTFTEEQPSEHPAAQPAVKIRLESATVESAQHGIPVIEKPVPQIDLFSTEMSGFSEKLKEIREKSYASERQASQRKELKAAISINEKFLFINELFDGNLREYNLTIEMLNGFADLREALDFLDNLRIKNLWESESVAFKRLTTLVEGRY